MDYTNDDITWGWVFFECLYLGSYTMAFFGFLCMLADIVVPYFV